MNSRTQERVEQWDSRPFDGGYDGLGDLGAADFSGAVTVAGAWLFLLNGRIVGAVDGTVQDFENGSGTAYEAPHPSLPLLCAMTERGGETRATYYTNETSLREVDRTLQDNSFTGYVELSENVLSGDYYAVYYGGRRMAAAYIGSAERLVTGEDAFERAADEVGIYEVVDVDIEVTDVPGSGSPPATGATEPDAPAAEPEADATLADERSSEANAETGSTPAGDDAGADPAPAEDEAPADDRGITTSADAEPNPASTRGITDADPAGEDVNGAADAASADPGAAPDDERPAAETPSPDAATANGAAEESNSTADPSAATEDTESPPSAPGTAEPSPGADGSDTAEAEDRPQSASQGNSSPDPEVVEAAAKELDRQDIDWTDDADTADRPTDAAGDELEQRLEQEEQWRETRRIPSIDPDNTEPRESPASGGPSSSRTDSADGAESTAHRSAPSTRAARGAEGSAAPKDATTQRDDDQRTVTEQLDRLTQQRNALRERVAELEAERDRLRSKTEELSSTADRLRSRVQELESELEAARSTGGTEREGAAGIELSGREALSQTNLFVRYVSKSQPTLKTAHEERVDRSEVASNLRLEHHTQFDETDAVVDGSSYEDVLTESMEYRFVEWLTTELFFEIRDTGHADALGEFYDAIFRIDRVEFRATISLEDDETEDVPDSVAFDVVAYDKMGSPLLVANLNDSREPASETMLTEMEAAASAVKANYPDLAAAVVVTSSYFEPGALEVVEAATSGGFLSRGSQLSYVNLSRKQGYHLCLAESRSEGFHMNVPEL